MDLPYLQSFIVNRVYEDYRNKERIIGKDYRMWWDKSIYKRTAVKHWKINIFRGEYEIELIYRNYSEGNHSDITGWIDDILKMYTLENCKDIWYKDIEYHIQNYYSQIEIDHTYHIPKGILMKEIALKKLHILRFEEFEDICLSKFSEKERFINLKKKQLQIRLKLKTLESPHFPLF